MDFTRRIELDATYDDAIARDAQPATAGSCP